MKINPVLRKEVKLTARSFRTGLLIAIYTGVLAFVAVLMLASFIRNFSYGASLRDLPILYIFIESIQMVLIFFIVPSLTASAISGERERQTLDILLSTKMSPLSIILGKLASSLSKVILLIISSIPVFSLVFIFGGVNATHILQLLLFYMVTAIYIGAIGIFVSTLFKSTRVSNAVVYGVGLFIVLGTLFIAVMYFQFVTMRNINMAQGTPPVPKVPFYLYINPALGYGSLMVNQVGSMFPFGVRTLLQYGNVWIINMIVMLVVSAILLFSASLILNPVKKNRKRKV